MNGLPVPERSSSKQWDSKPVDVSNVLDCEEVDQQSFYSTLSQFKAHDLNRYATLRIPPRSPKADRSLVNYVSNHPHRKSNSPTKASLLGHKKTSSGFSFDSMHQKAASIFGRRRKSDVSDLASKPAAEDDFGDMLYDDDIASSFAQNRLHVEEGAKAYADLVQNVFPELEWLAQEEPNLMEKSLLEVASHLLIQDNLESGVSDQKKDYFLQQEELQVLKQELSRITEQIRNLSSEFDKETKFREASLNLMKLYSSNPTTIHATMRRTGFKKHAKKHVSTTSYDSRDMTTGNITEDSQSLDPAVKASSAAFMESASYVFHLASALKELTERERLLSTKITRHTLASILVNFSKTTRILRERELEHKRALILTEDQRKGHSFESWHIILRDEMMRQLCEEIVRTNGNNLRTRKEKPK